MKRALILGIFFLAVTLFFAEVLFGPRVFLDANPYHFDPWRHYAMEGDLEHETHRTDALFTYFPRSFELSQAVRSGRFPLWNPHILCGMPFFADPQTRVLYPIALLLVLVDPVEAMGIDMAIHMFIAMVGMYLFLRSIRVSTLGAILGALVFPFSSFFYVRLGHPTFVATASWIPWFFFGFEYARRHGARGKLLLTLFLVMGYLAGFPQVFLFGIGALVVYALYLSLDTKRGTRRRSVLKTIKILSISGGLAVLLISVQLIPFVELTRNSIGLLVDFEYMKEYFMTPPVLLLRSFFPDLFGNPVAGTDWSAFTREVKHTNNPEFAIYCGMGALLAALAGIAFLKRERRVRAFLILIGLAVAMATVPLFMRIGYTLIPTLRASRISRISVVGCFALSALAGLGFSLISERLKGPVRKRILVLVGLGLAVTLVVGVALSLTTESFLGGYAEKAKTYSDDIWQRTVVAARSGKVKGWLDTPGEAWAGYERRQIARGIAAALVSGILLCLYLSVGRDRKNLLAGIGIIFILVTAVEIGHVAKGYFVSQVSHDLFRTKGISFLEEVLGKDSRWRIIPMRFERQDARAFPPNTNLIFGMHCMTGASTILPESTIDLPDAIGYREVPARLLDRQAPMGWIQVISSNLASARYALGGTRSARLPVSPVLRVVAARAGRKAPIELLTLGPDAPGAGAAGSGGRGSGASGSGAPGPDARLALIQDPGKRMNFAMDIEEVRALDFAVGFNSNARASGDTAVFWLTWTIGPREIKFSKPFDLYRDRGRWHPVRMDISSHSGGHVGIKMGIAIEGEARGIKAGWSGFDLVQSDCIGARVPGGYQVDVDRDVEFVSLTLRRPLGAASGKASRSAPSEVPLEIMLGDGRRSQRWVAFPSHMQTRTLAIDVRDRTTDRLVVRSDSTFTLEAARVVLVGDAYTDYQLIWDGDMCVYENHAAVERGVCIDRDDVDDALVKGRRTIEVGHLDGVGDVKCGSCRITTYEPERIELSVSASRECFLLFQDSFYPGWKASVDGIETDIIRTDIGMRAIELAPGDHEVEMHFKPGSLRLGTLLSLLGIILTCAYIWKAGVRSNAGAVAAAKRGSKHG